MKDQSRPSLQVMKLPLQNIASQIIIVPEGFCIMH